MGRRGRGGDGRAAESGCASPRLRWPRQARSWLPRYRNLPTPSSRATACGMPAANSSRRCSKAGFATIPGTLMLSFGYFNRNFEQELDVPIGPDNKIEPGPADQGQPTHFVPRRQWGAFAVPVSKDVEQRLRAEKKTVTWTLRANSQTVTIPANIGPAYAIDALKEPTVGNTPPVLRFEGAPASGTGPLGAKAIDQGGRRHAGHREVLGRPTTSGLATEAQHRRHADVGALSRRGRGDHRRCHQVGRRQRRGERDGDVRRTRRVRACGSKRCDTEIHDFHCCWSNGYIHASVGAR